MCPNVLSAPETTGPISQWVLPVQFYTCLPIAPINLLELLQPHGFISGLKSMVITVTVQPSSEYVSSVIPFSPSVFLHFLLLCLFSSLWLFPPCVWPWHMTHRVKDTGGGSVFFSPATQVLLHPSPTPQRTRPMESKDNTQNILLEACLQKIGRQEGSDLEHY